MRHERRRRFLYPERTRTSHHPVRRHEDILIALNRVAGANQMQREGGLAAALGTDQENPAPVAAERGRVDQRSIGKIAERNDRQLGVQRLAHATRGDLLAHDHAVLRNPIVRTERLDRIGDVLGRRAIDVRITFQIAKRLVNRRIARGKRNVAGPSPGGHFECDRTSPSLSSDWTHASISPCAVPSTSNTLLTRATMWSVPRAPSQSSKTMAAVLFR